MEITTLTMLKASEGYVLKRDEGEYTASVLLRAGETAETSGWIEVPYSEYEQYEQEAEQATAGAAS